jgi:hypothetical protein
MTENLTEQQQRLTSAAIYVKAVDHFMTVELRASNTIFLDMASIKKYTLQQKHGSGSLNLQTVTS